MAMHSATTTSATDRRADCAHMITTVLLMASSNFAHLYYNSVGIYIEVLSALLQSSWLIEMIRIL